MSCAFFFNDTATTEIYTLSLHDALPILFPHAAPGSVAVRAGHGWRPPTSRRSGSSRDRKSTRLNSSHGYISYAVFCLKKKKRVLAQQQHEPDRPTQLVDGKDTVYYTTEL